MLGMRRPSPESFKSLGDLMIVASAAGFAAIAAVPVIHSQSPFHIRPLWFYLVAGVFALGVVLRMFAPIFGVKPKITIDGGNAIDFRNRLSEHDPREHAIFHDILLSEIYTTRLRVRETNNAQAKNVQVRTVSDGGFRVLTWLGGKEEFTIQGKGYAWVRLCEVFDYSDGRESVANSHHPGVSRGKCADIELAVVIDGKPQKGRQSFRIDWSDEKAWFPEVTPLP